MQHAIISSLYIVTEYHLSTLNKQIPTATDFPTWPHVVPTKYSYYLQMVTVGLQTYQKHLTYMTKYQKGQEPTLRIYGPHIWCFKLISFTKQGAMIKFVLED